MVFKAIKVQNSIKKRDSGELKVVDNRSAGFFGIGGSFNFKSGDISGTAAKTSEEKMGQGTEYFAQEQMPEDTDGNQPYVDRSAQLNATLNSLAMMNVANLLKKNKDQKNYRKLSDKELAEHKYKIPVWEDYQDENEDFLYVD